MRKIKVFVVDDHQLIIEGLHGMLDNEESIDFVGSALNGKDCLLYIKNNRIDVLLLDINIGEINGIDLCKEILLFNDEIKIIGISSYTQGSFISKIIQNGASGYLYKNAVKSEILEAIQTSYNGKIYLSSDAKINYTNYQKQMASHPSLTKRELEILKLIKKGLTNVEISNLLYISIDTVDTHRKNLYAKLEVKNTAMLIAKAVELELI